MQNGVCGAPATGWMLAADGATAVCPENCRECPGWSYSPHHLWGVLLAVSMVSPLLTWLMLPFLQGQYQCVPLLLPLPRSVRSARSVLINSRNQTPSV